MPRANRHFIPGYVWHITHRCHKKEFLLKFKKDRQRWLYWLFESKKRYGLVVLDYIVTSNHIHLLVQENSQNEITQSMQLIAGRTAQEFNQRKNRQGAYWEDRYHATAVDSQSHLLDCITYIDLNMVRAGVVEKPSDWLHSGYNEIQSPPQRYQIIDRQALKNLLGIKSEPELKALHQEWVADALQKVKLEREEKWTTGVAIGRYEFAKSFQESGGATLKHRKIQISGNSCIVKEPTMS